MYGSYDKKLLQRCTSNAFAQLTQASGQPITLFVRRMGQKEAELLTLPQDDMLQTALQDRTQQMFIRRSNGAAENFVPFSDLLARAGRAEWQDKARLVPGLYNSMSADPNLHLHIVFRARGYGLACPAQRKQMAIARWQAKCAFNSIKEHPGGFRSCGRGISARILLSFKEVTPVAFDLNP